MLRPIHLDPALIGHPLPWDVYSESGVLLAAAGLVLTDTAQFNRLGARPLFREGEQLQAIDTPIARLIEVAKRSEAALHSLHVASIHAHARELLVLYRADADACLGYASLESLASPSLSHALRVLFVAQLLAEKLDFSPEERVSLAAAALSMNLAAKDMHDRYALYTGVLNGEDRGALHNHPHAAATWLERAGVTDSLWLETVRQHHENMDGSGYPLRLSSRGICLGARILRVADVYCAKVRRHYVPPKSPLLGLQSLFGRERAHLDSQLTGLLLRRIGLYPPGRLVRLANRETACIARRGADGTPRWAVSILDARDRPLDPPQARDLRSRQHAIIRSADRQANWPAINWMSVWGY